MSKTKVRLKDGWSTDQKYKNLYQTDQEILDILDLLELKRSRGLLDNACGNGEISIQAALRFPDLNVYGYDALDSAITEARLRASEAKVRNLDFEVAWADSLPLENGTVDRAVFRNALHHITDPCAVFSEIARCLDDSGLFVMQTPFNFWEESFSAFLSDFHFLMEDSHRRYYHTLNAIERDLRRCGLFSLSHRPSTYNFPYVTKSMKDLIVKHNFEDRLKLKEIGKETWSVTLYWMKLTAEKRKAEQDTLGNPDKPVS